MAQDQRSRGGWWRGISLAGRDVANNICLMHAVIERFGTGGFHLMKCSRRIRAIVSPIGIPNHLLHSKAGSPTAQCMEINFGHSPPA
ncbi:hypothetical protein IVB05_09440 [Bradyrhizobium sp. 170]|nr:hypothetical protein [Bradyrhizobium sp. 170]UPK05776.1 hypothetical protein IVB05_09440 [Bradyrhizobium sp. 170]